MDKNFLIREILIIGRSVDPASISKRVIALTNMLRILDAAIAGESYKIGFDLYVSYAEANLVWNICYSRLASDGIYIGTPYTYQCHLDGISVSANPLLEVACYN